MSLSALIARDFWRSLLSMMASQRESVTKALLLHSVVQATAHDRCRSRWDDTRHSFGRLIAVPHQFAFQIHARSRIRFNQLYFFFKEEEYVYKWTCSITPSRLTRPALIVMESGRISSSSTGTYSLRTMNKILLPLSQHPTTKKNV